MAEREGTAAAAKRYGVSPATVRSWKARGAREAAADVASEPVSVAAEAAARSSAAADPLAEAEERAARAHEIAAQALEAAAECIVEGDAVGARNMSVTLGILFDKSQRLQAGIASLRESGARVEQSRAEALRQVLTVWADACGIPLGDAGRRLLGDLLRQSTVSAAVSVPADLAELARGEVRGHFERLIDRERAVDRVRAGEVDDDDEADDDDDGGDEPSAADEAPADGSEQPARGPELVRRMGPNGPVRSDAEIRRIAKEAARQDDGHPGFLAGRRPSRGW